MPDYQKIADDVRTFVQSEDQTRDSALDQLAADYADTCQSANARLRRCGDFLRRGLRSEAIHLAKEQPDLLDVVAAMDVPGLEQWESICSMYGLAKPPRLMMEVAAELNDAYGLEEPLQEPLGQLRLLVLARAPAIERLVVVRNLMAIDPETSHWAADAQALERVAITTMRQDAKRIIDAADPFSARRMADSLISPDWIEPPPKDIIDSLTAVEMQGMLQEMAELQSAGQTKKVSRMLDAIDKVIAKRAFAPAADVSAAIRDGREWVAFQKGQATDRQAFDKIVANLEHALWHEATPEVLQDLHTQASQFNLPIPSRVSARYAEVMASGKSRAAAAKRRNALIAAAALVTVAAVSVWGLSQVRINGHAADVIGKLTAASDDYAFDQGEQTWKELLASDPSLAARDDVRAAHQRLVDSAAAESQRVQHLQGLLNAAKQSRSSPTARLGMLSTAQNYVRLDSDRSEVRQLREQVLGQMTSEDKATAPATLPTPPSAAPTAAPPAIATPAVLVMPAASSAKLATPEAKSPADTQPAQVEHAIQPAARAAEPPSIFNDPAIENAPSAAPQVVKDSTPQILFDREMTIPAKGGTNDKRISIGAVKAGQHIRFGYVRGVWTAFPRADYPPASPDDEPVKHENVLRPRLCEVLPDGSLHPLVTIPGQTKKSPFDFVVDHNSANLVLNIDDEHPGNNVGEAVYHIQILNPAQQ